jgi:putative ABC transport system permease protein
MGAQVNKEQRQGDTMRFLALADLRHEWLLNLCIILALAAVLAPLLLLLGLKHGTIQTLRNRLIEDPVYRELKPQQSLELNEAWFKAMAARPEVAFIIPTILRGSSLVRLSGGDSRPAEAMDLLPTGPGDVLLLESGGVIPGEGEAALSADAAAKLGLAAGDMVQTQITRHRDGRLETATASLKVIQVLPPKADALPRIYAPFSFVVDVETYREGKGVPKRGWPGGSAKPYLSFDGVFVVAPEGLDSITMNSLTVGTGFSVIEPLTAAGFAERTGLGLPEGFQIVDAHVVRESAPWSTVQAVQERLRGRSVAVLPYVREIKLRLEPPNGAPFTVQAFGLSPSAEERAMLGLPELPWGVFRTDKAFPDYAQILLPAPVFMQVADQTLTASLADNPRSGGFPLRVSGQSFTPYGIVPVELLAVLRTGATREIVYAAEQQGFVLTRAGYSGFRLYARRIDDVAGLHQGLREQGIETIAQVQAIERIRILDRGLNRLFWLVAVVGISGGVAALVASLYAAVERKKQEISMLRLMGLSRADVSRFPIYQSAAIAALAAGLAIVGFYGLAAVINAVFAADLGLGERICQLPSSRLLITFIMAVTAAALSSLVAAWRTTSIEPAEAIRVE